MIRSPSPSGAPRAPIVADAFSGLRLRGERAYWGVFGLVWLFLVLPPTVVRFPPMHDYSNHLARVFILGHLGQSPTLQSFYAAEWLPYPNLAIDVLVSPLVRVMSAGIAGRLFLVLLPTMFMFGADRVARGLHGRFSWSVPLCGFFFFNTFYFYGFVNYIFGVGLYLLAYGLWLSEHRSHHPLRFAGLFVLAPACFLAHKTALAFLAVSMVCTLFVDRKQLTLPRLIRHAALFAPCLAIHFAVKLAKGPANLEWETPMGKVKGVASLAMTYHPLLDAVSTLVFVGALLWIARGVVRANRAALLTAAALGVLFLAFPTGVGGTWAADRRFLLPAAVVAILSVDPDLVQPRIRAAWMAALGLVFARAGGVLYEWPALSDDVAARVDVLDAIPSGARVYSLLVIDKKNKSLWVREMRLMYLHHYAVINREAYVNGLFVGVASSPLRLRQEYTERREPELGRPPAQVDWKGIFEEFDYVFATKIDETYRTFLEQHCKVVRQKDDAALYERCAI